MLFSSGIAASTQQCSAFCVCDTWYDLERASCVGRHLYNIHTGAPNNVQALDLSDNVISLLTSFELANIGFTKLKYLNLSKNAISEIELNAFDGLADLMVLDLSRNRLDDIPAEVLEKNKNLRILRLSKNNFKSHIPKLRSSSLTELSLDSCQISHLPLDTFNGLKHLRHLDLANNLMIQMNAIALQTLHFLKKLSLEGNPWSCDKVMLDLQMYLRNKDIEFNEICSKKGNVRKFEKMVVLPTMTRNYHHSKIANPEEPKERSNRIEMESNILNNKTLSTCQETANPTPVTDSEDNSVAYWFFFLGFILGILSRLVISYIWLLGTCLYNRRCSLERFNSGFISRELSLLSLDGRMESDGSLSEFYPNTPPPAYRDVMLQPSLYRYPSRISNLNRDR
ncbi:Leucine-rich repeat-containing protein 4B [Melipona quadrifasciata]|uniref:Leucine-rich repeat-containing protein 4B n=1 Tax=Melipona quadrifasciata TaxID=166423 RepID=A0A0M8ZWB6_9HYME|nr:Leucine-rich repeat-containing protein 4B [Melipona quadrifasciata]